jgi:hypothetical protein
MKKLNYKMKNPIISEQTTSSSRQTLEKFLSDGCVKVGTIVSMQSQNPLLQFAIKQESTKTPGKFRYLFADNRIGSFNDTGKFEFSPSKFSCQGIQQSAAAAVTATQQSETDSKIATEMKKGWKTLETLKAEGVDLTTLNQVFDKQVIGNVALFRPKGDVSTFTSNTSIAQFNQDQLDFIDRFTQKGYKLNPTRIEQMNLVKVTGEQLGAPSDLFPNGLVMWYDANQQSSIGGREDSVLSDILDNQSIDRTACRKNIEDFYELYRRRNSAQVDPATIDRARRVVQACKDEHYGKWGVTGGNKFDGILDTLSGSKQGGPGTQGPSSIFRIK